MSDSKSDEQRKSPRIRVDCEVTLEHPGGSLSGPGHDMNDRSMLVLTEELLPVGTAVTLRCVDDVGTTVIVKGEITRHQAETDEYPAGLVVTETSAG
ncbi:MAG: PilZ domain-containing protein [Deltaproteobacteria bacterium]|nr:PilZ domain-containing protein [Deltaproteobacteria bacterium]